jgi:hypothetical protein
MHEQEEEKEENANTEPPPKDTGTNRSEESTDMETEDQEEIQEEDTPTHITRSDYGIFADAIYKHLEKEPEEYERELYLSQDMEDMKQDDIEGALTDHHEDLQGVDNGSEMNEGVTCTNWGQYVDVIWELKGTLPGYDERELYRNHIRGLPREEFAEAVR